MDYPAHAPSILPFDTRLSATTDHEAFASSVRRIALAAAIAGVLLFLTDHNWLISRYEDFSETSEAMEASAAGGNLIRSFAMLALAGIGLISLLSRGGYALRLRSTMGFVILAAAVWCTASWFWSIEPAIALRRLVASGCLALAALGAARRLTPRELATAALSCALAFVVIGFIAELSLGSFRPWLPEYRFAGTLHPNHQGLNCALIVMAAMYLAQHSRRHRAALWSLAVVGLVGLWMTKSRTPLAAVVVAQLSFWFLAASWKAKAVAALAAIGLVSAAILVAGDNVVDGIGKAALMGRADEEEVGALSGRVPLWEELSESIARRPLQGFGFNSFWIPKNIEDISDSQSWAISVAHSTYLDLTLGIGIVGAALCAAVVVLGLIQAVLFQAHQPALGYGFIAVLLLFGLLHGLLESGFANPGFAPLVAQAGLAMLAFVDSQEYSERLAAASNQVS